MPTHEFCNAAASVVCSNHRRPKIACVPWLQVIWYDGLCERTYVEQRTQFVDMSDAGRRGGPQMLKPKPGFLTTPQDKFQQAFWCSAGTGGQQGLSAALGMWHRCH
jgi:hypothetical protein